MRTRSQSVARDFDRVLRVLENWGYVDGWALTDAGKILARTFHECDLLIVECLRQGLLDDLDPAALAGLVSVFVYEHRSPEPPPTAWFPSPTVRKRWQRIAEISYELEEIEEEAGLAVHRPPDPTFVAVAFAWAAGEGFAEVVEAEELSGGDFVRTMKQLIDVLRQLALVAPERATRRSAEQAADQLFRGVVAASSAVEPVDDRAEASPIAASGAMTIRKGEAVGRAGGVPARSAGRVDRSRPARLGDLAPPTRPTDSGPRRRRWRPGAEHAEVASRSSDARRR